MKPQNQTHSNDLSITINGKSVAAREGRTILDVAREQGIRIPTLCYHEKLQPLESCRLCVVEVEGVRAPVTACSTPITEGMVITTRSTALEQLRRETLKMILLNHPLNCTPCELNGNCQLQDLAYEYDITPRDLLTYDIAPREFEVVEYATPLIEYHPQRCIMCGRCIAACTEITGVSAIQLVGSGADTRIGPVPVPAGQHELCVSCGECMAVCPVNALTEVMAGPKGKPWNTSHVKTVCGYCGCGCELTLDVVGDAIVGVSPSEGGVNDGELCTKGRFGYDFVNHKDRLTQPLIRRGESWEPATWDEALDLVAERFVEIRSNHGPDAFAGLSSARCTNEENYLFQKFTRGVIGTNNVDHCARL